jgi:outer membrane protein assembly factor BamE (lipoprotein component of BamABCDE complex)
MKSVYALLLALALAACAHYPTATAVHPGESQADVRAKLGAPAAERKLAGGETAWYYVTAPSGYYTWRVVFGGDGRVRVYSQVLTEKDFLAISGGASRDAVLDLLGPPMEKMSFERSDTETWTYRWIEGTQQMLADATFGAKGLINFSTYPDPAFTGASLH